MKQLRVIRIYRGATTTVEFDLSGFNFMGGSLIFTAKDSRGNLVKRQELVPNEDGVAFLEFKPEDTPSHITEQCKYDLMLHLEEGIILPQCLPTRLEVLETVGGLIDENYSD